MHTGFSLLSATVLSSWTLLGALFPAIPSRPIALLVTLVGAACVHPRVLNGALGVVPRLLKKPVIRWNGSWTDGVLLATYATAAWWAYGVAYWLLIASLTEVPFSELSVLTGVPRGSGSVDFAGGPRHTG
jgi:hypothetical protein